MDKLEQLRALDQEVIRLDLEKESKIYEVMGEMVARAVKDIELEYEVKKGDRQRDIERLESEIRNEVLAVGENRYSPCGYKVMFVKGRVKWDTKGLDGYAVAHPEVNVFRSIGEPTTSIYRKSK